MARYAYVDAAGAIIALLDGTPNDWPDLRDAGVLRRVAQAGVTRDWRWDGSTFVAPGSAPTAALAPLALRQRLTDAERSAITLAAAQAEAAGDPTLRVWLDDLNAAQEVHLGSSVLRAGFQGLVDRKLLTAERMAEILA